jgi:hypothetical protein
MSAVVLFCIIHKLLPLDSTENFKLFTNPYYYNQENCSLIIMFQVQNMGWADVTGWVAQGGAILGTKRTLPKSRMAQVAARLAEFKIHGLLIIGGFEVSFLIVK